MKLKGSLLIAAFLILFLNKSLTQSFMMQGWYWDYPKKMGHRP